jgi:two-component system, chemotaxis family, protein-glutamate methylesterase/glutaminase
MPPSSKPIRVLIAEDSPTARALLVHLFSSSPDFEVAGAVENGVEAIARARELSPNLIVMDVYMPIVDGLDATKDIMRDTPTPIVMVSGSSSTRDVALGLSALQAGALILMGKPRSPDTPGYEDDCRQLLSMAKAMAAVKVVRRWDASGSSTAGRSRPTSATSVPTAGRRIRLIAIGTSTGGPAALHRILIDLPSAFPVPIVVVQHMAHGFIDGLASWLSANVPLRVVVAAPGAMLEPGTVYLGADDVHFGVGADGRISPSKTAAIGGFRPSVDFLFDSCGRAYGAGLAALILTGMGQDGVDGLRTVRARGGHIIAQDERSSIVFGMNGKAIENGLVDEVLPLEIIGERLNQMVDFQNR